MVEHNLAKVGVASSSLVSRSKELQKTPDLPGFFCGSGFFIAENVSKVWCVAAQRIHYTDSVAGGVVVQAMLFQ